MSDIDQQIVSFLQFQGYGTTKSIANSTGTSERTVRRHLDVMMKENLVKVIAVPNPVLCGFHAWCEIGIKTDSTYLHRIAQILVDHPSVHFTSYSLGRFDVIIGVRFDNVARLSFFVNSELARIKGVLGYETWILAYPRKFSGFFWPPGPEPLSGYDGKTIKYDEDFKIDNVDRNILAILQKDGLAQPQMISSELNLGESTIRRRIKRMLDNKVFIRETLLSPQILQGQTWATIGIMTDDRDANEVVDSLLKHNAVYLAAISLGKFNIMIEAHFQNINLLNTFATKELPSVKGICSIETFVHAHPLKAHGIVLSIPGSQVGQHSEEV